MATTFQTQIEDYVGTIVDTTSLTDYLTAGAKQFVNRIPEDEADKYGSALTDSGSGVSVTAYRVLRAHKGGYRARRIDAGLKTQAGLTGSLLKTTTNSPIHYIENGLGYVLPGGGTIIGMSYPSVLYSDTTISNFPSRLERGVVLFAVIQACVSKLNVSLDALHALSYSAPSAPSAPTDFTLTASAPTPPADASYTYTDATLGTYTATTIASSEVAPTYTKPTTAASFTNLSSYITSGSDLEKAEKEIGQQQTILDMFGKDLYNELNEFNKELETYKAVIQKEITQAQLDQQRLLETANKTTDLSIQNKAKDLEKQIVLSQTLLQKYASQISSYGQSVNAEVQTYQQKLQKFSSQLGLYQGQLQNAQQQYQGDQARLTSEVNHYQLILTAVKKEYEDFVKVAL